MSCLGTKVDIAVAKGIDIEQSVRHDELPSFRAVWCMGVYLVLCTMDIAGDSVWTIIENAVLRFEGQGGVRTSMSMQSQLA